MTGKLAQIKIDKIMGIAFDEAAKILESEVKKLLIQHPKQYERFVLAVGWGPTFFAPDGDLVDSLGGGNKHKHNAAGERVSKFADNFYDSYGANNRQVILTAKELKAAMAKKTTHPKP